ncbi:phosphoribosyltransferase [Pectobacterium polaris]|uniref:phosphoribosyltransferase n=1 Tax=Pectobacterium polaris TaxID=2042057 RepID=UPI001968DC5A|nr:phosphoribosyltransferase [Pectobacterium polaris]MBN3215176.1 phosphoribosyltransferase [Pectobacterium polaris]
MGFTVDTENRLVTVDHSHNNYSVTTLEGNPITITLANGLKVTSIFSRTKGKKAKRGEPALGDNSPMLYVIKGLHGLRTRRRDIGMLCVSFRDILPVFLGTGFSWDWLVPLPSSSPVCSQFANKVHQRSQVGVCQPTALVKITADQVMRNIGGLRILTKDKAMLSADVRRFIRDHGPQAPFQIKYAKTHLRQHINPLMWGTVPAGTAPPRTVLLIDDMVTSGTSIACAANTIKARYPAVQIEALTLFGTSK